MIQIGHKLKELRREEGITQQEFARRLGIGRENYTRYETNAVRPNYETLILIADYYNISLDELFDRE